METTDGVPNVELGEEGAESEPHPSTDVPAPIEESPGTVEDDPASPKDRDETDYSEIELTYEQTSLKQFRTKVEYVFPCISGKQSHQREHNSGGSSSVNGESVYVLCVVCMCII